MKNQFIHIFKAVNPSEQEAFRHYIGHFYGQQKVILSTFERAVSAVALDDEQAFLAAIKNDKKTLNDLSDLKKWLLEFLTIQEVKNNGYDAQFLTLQALQKRGLRGVLSDKSKLLNQDLNKHEKPDIWLNLLKLRLNHADYFNTENEKMDNHQDHLKALLEQLDNFYISTKLRYTAELESRRNMLKEQYNPRFLTEILASIDGDDALNPIIKNLYLPLLNLIKDKSEAAYFELKAFMAKNPAYDQQEKLAVVLYLLNFTAQQIAKGNPAYNNEYFDVAQIGLNQALFTANGCFPTTTFNNIVNVVVHLKKYAWAKNFIRDWSIYLTPQDRLIASNLAGARVHFEEKNFDAATDLLREITKHKDVHYALQIRILMARIFYEQKQKRDFQNSHCDNLELYIRRNIKNEGLKESTLNFVKILRLLITEKTKKQVLKKLEKQEPTTLRYWLVEKTNELKT